MYIVYQAKNTITNKVYIGFSKNLNRRISSHYSYALNRATNNCHFANALKKYPIDSWEWSIIDTAETLTEIKLKEIYYIELFDTYNSGYNNSKGGDGSHGRQVSEETRKKISQKNKGKVINEEQRLKLSAALKGRKLSEEDKKNKSIANKNRKDLKPIEERHITKINNKNGIKYIVKYCYRKNNTITVGTFSSYEEAIEARKKALAEFEMFGEIKTFYK